MLLPSLLTTMCLNAFDYSTPNGVQDRPTCDNCLAWCLVLAYNLILVMSVVFLQVPRHPDLVPLTSLTEADLTARGLAQVSIVTVTHSDFLPSSYVHACASSKLESQLSLHSATGWGKGQPCHNHARHCELSSCGCPWMHLKHGCIHITLWQLQA